MIRTLKRIAIIDIGSNSARLVISHIFDNASHQLVYSQKKTLRLSKEINEQGELTEKGLQKTVNALRSFDHMCKIFNTQHNIIICTAAIRNAKNSAAVLRELSNVVDSKINVIPGEREAQLAYQGVINTMLVEDAVIFDLGGGSTELILVHDRQELFKVSLPFGAVNITEQFSLSDTMTKEIQKKVTNLLQTELSRLPWLQNVQIPLIGVGGTARSLAKIFQKQENYPYNKLHNFPINPQQFETFHNNVITTNNAERRKIAGLSTERADIFLAGITIINTIMQTVCPPEIIISGSGLREGVFYEYYHSKFDNNAIEPADILKRSIYNLLKLYNLDIEHAEKVAEMSEKMFVSWFALHRLPKEYRKILLVAALLHDIGISINYYNHDKHTKYLIENAQLYGLSHREQLLAALVAGWHNGISNNLLVSSLHSKIFSDEDELVARKLAVFLAIAESLDYTQTNTLKDIEPSFASNGEPSLTLIANGKEDGCANIEFMELNKQLRLFKKEFGVKLQVLS